MIERWTFTALRNRCSRTSVAGVAGVRIKTPRSACWPGSAPASQRHRDIRKNAVQFEKTVLGLRREDGGIIVTFSLSKSWASRTLRSSRRRHLKHEATIWQSTRSCRRQEIESDFDRK